MKLLFLFPLYYLFLGTPVDDNRDVNLTISQVSLKNIICNDSISYVKRLKSADKKINNYFILSNYDVPPFIQKNLHSILNVFYYDKEENNSYFMYTNKNASQVCEVTSQGKIKKNYRRPNIMSNKIRVYKNKNCKRKTISTNYTNFVTEKGIKLGITREDFFREKDSSIFNIDTVGNRIMYSYFIQIFNPEEADAFYGSSYYTAIALYICQYIFDLRSNKLVEYSIANR